MSMLWWINDPKPFMDQKSNNSETYCTFKLALVPVWLWFPHLLNRHSRVPIWILLSHQIGASTKTKWPRKAQSSGERMNSAGENVPQRLRTRSRMAAQWEYAIEIYSASCYWIHKQHFVWNIYMMNVQCLTPEDLSLSFFLYLSYKTCAMLAITVHTPAISSP